MMRTISFLIFSTLLVLTCVAVSTAQKKEPTKKEASKKEVAPTQSSQSPGTIKEVLLQYVGKTTNLGTLKKVTGDFFILEEDGATVMHPLSTIHTIKLVKDEESGETKIEIRLIARD